MGESNLVAVFGRKGQGKSSLANRIVEEHRHEDRSLHFVVHDSTKEWVPRPRLDVCLSKDWDVEETAQYAIDHPNKVVLVVDEIDKYCPNHAGGLKPGSNLHLIVNEGRHLGVALLCAARRVARVHTDIGYLADTIFFLRHTGPNDLGWIAEVCGDDVAEATACLPDHHWLRHEL